MNEEVPRTRAPRNKTVTLTRQDRETLPPRLACLRKPVTLDEVVNQTICQDAIEAIEYLPSASVDLLFADPPYNLNKTFNQASFAEMDLSEYECWLEKWVSKAVRLLRADSLCLHLRRLAVFHGNPPGRKDGTFSCETESPGNEKRVAACIAGVEKRIRRHLVLHRLG